MARFSWLILVTLVACGKHPPTDAPTEPDAPTETPAPAAPAPEAPAPAAPETPEAPAPDAPAPAGEPATNTVPGCPDTETRRYVADTGRCALIRYVCAEGEQAFSDGCGCGCERKP